MKPLVLWCGVLGASSAWANAFELTGASPRAAGMAGAQTAEANDASATFYNPALLLRDRNGSVLLGLQYLGTSAWVRRSSTGKTLDCTHCNPPDASGIQFAAVIPFSGKLKDRLSLGLNLYAPTDVFVSTRAEDPSRPFWYQLDNDPRRMMLFFGAGVRIIDGLALGVGAQVLADLKGRGADVSADLFSKTVQTREVNSRFVAYLSPVVGLSWEANKLLRFGASYRHEMRNFYQIPAHMDLQGIGILDFSISGFNHYTPPTLTAGAAWDVKERITLTGDLSYEWWSRAPTPYVDVTLNLNGDMLTALGLENALAFSAPHTPPRFANTLNGRVGMEVRPSTTFVVRAGALFQSNMVPSQDAAGTNILNGTRIGIATGLTTALAQPGELFEGTLYFDLAVHGSAMLPREAHKESSDSVPSYRYAAALYGGQAAIRYQFGN